MPSVAKINKAGAEYILAVKDNQKHLHDAIHTQLNVDHGRIETRSCGIITDMDWICSKDQ